MKTSEEFAKQQILALFKLIGEETDWKSDAELTPSELIERNLCLKTFIEINKEIQMEAYKAGMTFAGDMVVNYTVDNPTVECGNYAVLHSNILSARDNLKELP